MQFRSIGSFKVFIKHMMLTQINRSPPKKEYKIFEFHSMHRSQKYSICGDEVFVEL